MDASFEMGPSETDTHVTVLPKLSTGQKAMDIRLSSMAKSQRNVQQVQRTQNYLNKPVKKHYEKTTTTTSKKLFLTNSYTKLQFVTRKSW